MTGYAASVTDGEADFLLCDSCPKGGHYRCLGLQGVPDGDWHCEACLLPYTFIRGKRTCASCRAHFCKPCAKGRGQLVDIRPLATAGRKAKPLKVCKKCAARLTG